MHVREASANKLLSAGQKVTIRVVRIRKLVELVHNEWARGEEHLEELEAARRGVIELGTDYLGFVDLMLELCWDICEDADLFEFNGWLMQLYGTNQEFQNTLRVFGYSLKMVKHRFTNKQQEQERKQVDGAPRNSLTPKQARHPSLQVKLSSENHHFSSQQAPDPAKRPSQELAEKEAQYIEMRPKRGAFDGAHELAQSLPRLKINTDSETDAEADAEHRFTMDSAPESPVTSAAPRRLTGFRKPGQSMSPGLAGLNSPPAVPLGDYSLQFAPVPRSGETVGTLSTSASTTTLSALREGEPFFYWHYDEDKMFEETYLALRQVCDANSTRNSACGNWYETSTKYLAESYGPGSLQVQIFENLARRAEAFNQATEILSNRLKEVKLNDPAIRKNADFWRTAFNATRAWTLYMVDSRASAKRFAVGTPPEIKHSMKVCHEKVKRADTLCKDPRWKDLYERTATPTPLSAALGPAAAVVRR